MASFNRVILVGNLTRDPEVRYTPSGTAVTDVGLAVNRTWFDKQANERREETTFVDVTLWGRQAEVAGEYLSKGRSVLIEGRLQLDQWEDRESGQKRSRLRVVGENMTMLGGRADSPRGGRSQDGYQPSNQSYQTYQDESPPEPRRAGAEENSGPPQVPEDDVPF